MVYLSCGLYFTKMNVIIVLLVFVISALGHQPLCPRKATGHFPYAPDCRRFVICIKGRGVLQICAPETLFNPLTQKCDFPSAVTCLNTKTDNREQPEPQASYSHQVPTYSDPPDTREGRTQNSPNQDWKRGFKSNRVTPPPNFQNPNPYNGHAGIQSPNEPSFNTGSPFIILPMMFGGSPHTFNTPYQTPRYSSSQSMVFAQNQPGYPIPPFNPQFEMNWNQNPQSSQRASGYTQGAYQPQNPSSHPLSEPGGPSVYSPPHNFQPDQYPTYTQPQGYGSYSKPSNNQSYPKNSQPQSQPGYSPNQFYNTPNSTQPGFENRQDEPQAWKPQYNQGIPNSGQQLNTFRYQPSSVSLFHNSPLQGSQPGSPPNFQPQHSQPPNPNFPLNSRYPQNTQFVFPSSQTGSENPPTYPSQYSGGSNSPDSNLPANLQSNAQNPQEYFPSSQQGLRYPPANSESPYYPNYNPNIPQNVESPSGYNPQPQGEHSASREFETPQFSPQVPAKDQTPTRHPQNREPQISPQGGQPGYFLVNQNENEPPITTPTPVVNQKENEPPITKPTPVINQKENEPPITRPTSEYNSVDSSKHSAQCPKGASGLFPHPNCFKFLNCDQGRTFVMDCGAGTAFNPDISTCDYPEKVDCGKTISGPDPGSNEGEVVEADKNNDDI